MGKGFKWEMNGKKVHQYIIIAWFDYDTRVLYTRVTLQLALNSNSCSGVSCFTLSSLPGEMFVNSFFVPAPVSQIGPVGK